MRVRTRLPEHLVLRGSSGSVTPVAAAVIALIVVIGMFMVDLGIIFVSRSAAQNAADAAALACVQEAFPLFSSGRKSPQDIAVEVAGANGAGLNNCQVSPSGDEATVTVERRTGSLFLDQMGLAPKKVGATATAKVDVEKLMESVSIWYTDDHGIPINLPLIPPWLLKGMNSGTAVVMLALQQLGKPYVYATQGPNTFDCSGLVWYVYRQLGISLPRVSYQQACAGIPVSRAELQPGDLVLFRGNGHVGIYASEGQYIHAPHTGTVVSLASLSRRSDLSCCRRIIR